MAFSAVAISCAPSGRTVSLEPMTPDEVMRKLDERTASIRSMEAEGLLTFESPENSGSTSFELQIKDRDTVWMRFTGPFGISLGTLLLSPNRFSFHSVFDKKVFRGNPKPETLGRILNVTLSYDDIVGTLMGNFNNMKSPEDSISVSIDDTQYRLVGSNGGSSRYEMKVDGESFVTTEYVMFDGERKPVVVASSKRIEPVNDTYVPFLVRIIVPKQRQAITVAYNSVRVNSQPKKRFSIPVGLDEVEVENIR
jgi:hypothetical protein